MSLVHRPRAPRKPRPSGFVIPGSRSYYGKKLLEHGPLSGAEFREITGWPGRAAHKALDSLRNAGIAVRQDGVWRLR